jgi:2-polyprenyl-3-methyl-5-hydroxy-6-metoxy-1,4-benzoquinol methylase
MKCIFCYNEEFKILHSSNNYPSSVQKLLREEQISVDKKINMQILQCSACGLVQLNQPSYIKDSYYSDYLMTTSHSNYSKSYQHKLANNFIKKFDLESKNLVEIGCGDGNFLKILEKNNINVFGIEPSKKAFDLSIKKGLNVLNEYLTKKTSLKNKFDAFVIRQVLEHISKPNNFLQDIKYLLKKNAVGLIEVPSLHKAIKYERFFDFFPDHVAYYSNSTLSKVLSGNGYEVLDIFRSAEEEYLVAYVKVKKNLENIWIGLEMFTTQIQLIIIDYKNKNKKIAVWGAGGKGIDTLSLCNLSSDDFEFVIDSDPNKWGYYTPGSHLKIVSPKNISKVDCILITAMMYEKEIVRQIIKTGYGGDIGVISPSPKILTKNEVKILCQR